MTTAAAQQAQPRYAQSEQNISGYLTPRNARKNDFLSPILTLSRSINNTKGGGGGAGGGGFLRGEFLVEPTESSSSSQQHHHRSPSNNDEELIADETTSRHRAESRSRKTRHHRLECESNEKDAGGILNNNNNCGTGTGLGLMGHFKNLVQVSSSSKIYRKHTFF